MKIRNAMLRAAVLVCVLGLLSASNLGATAPGKDSLTVAAQTSLSVGVVPFVPGNAQNQWFYFYTCVTKGSTLVDTIPVDFTQTNTNGNLGDTETISFNVVGNPALASSITPPVSFGITDNGITLPETIAINFSAAVNGVYDANVQIKASPSTKAQLDHDTIHIRVHVKDSCESSDPVVCFFTDSSFGALLDCSGNPVPLTNGPGGAFQIVVNAQKATVVATNPGQFYYNLIWHNDTGLPHDITLDLSKTDSTLSTVGANSVHAYVFGSVSLSSPLVSQFDVVNTLGTPCGATGNSCKATIPVGVGDYLWVTWHLAYAKIGQPSSNVSPGACPGTELISATCTVNDGAALVTCTALASGYLKKQ